MTRSMQILGIFAILFISTSKIINISMASSLVVVVTLLLLGLFAYLEHRHQLELASKAFLLKEEEYTKRLNDLDSTVSELKSSVSTYKLGQGYKTLR